MTIEWKSGRYTGISLSLPYGLDISVIYEGIERLPKEDPHYNVNVFGKRLKVRSATEEEGKQRAMRVARKWLTEALQELPERDEVVGKT